jgi:GcrA cell cycle regulator
MTWTQELIDRLTALWANTSADEISQIFGRDGYAISRNAVIGKAHRLGLEKTATAPGKGPRTLCNPVKRNKDGIGVVVQAINRANKTREAPAKPQSFKPRVAGVTALRKTIVEVDFRTECHWPDDNCDVASEMTFCAHPVKAGSPYCEKHHAVAYNKRIKITDADRARRRAHATRVWFGASVKLVGNPAEVA